MTELGRTREWYDVDLDVFREQIAPSRVPAILRGLAADWPAVRAGRQDSATLREYLRKFDTGKPAPAFLSHPDIKGRFWYREDMAASTIDKALPPSVICWKPSLRPEACRRHHPSTRARSPFPSMFQSFQTIIEPTSPATARLPGSGSVIARRFQPTLIFQRIWQSWLQGTALHVLPA